MKKKLIALVTALTLCAVVVVGGTLAYFSYQTDEVKNTFLYDNDGGDGEIDIEEPGWEEDKEFTPDMEMSKDPYIISKAGKDKYWVAMTIEGRSDDVTAYNTLNGLLKDSDLTANPKVVGGPLLHIDGLDTTEFNYTVDGDGTIYAYFQTPIFGLDRTDANSTNVKSAPAFTKVKIQNQNVLEAILEANSGTFPSFDIVVKGYGVPTVNDTVITGNDPTTGKAIYAEFTSCEEAMAHAFGDVFANTGKTYTPISSGTTTWTGA